ncbi:hypothetical protein J416_11782 [Gracilibacillus halophilus YIM-C55.5]|uniref:Uncharacterized protein n=1 Tax=Gracilibacillus halophilus YIM-C55.5 TaxID=1308866 RepID=N4WP40_9BACI|nr:hypothetical protein [Gracilibacillus halophilus]ENH96255.1 hypothetical protein J416_11782 [Gracilibacillus halophilus YIM-C55.5]
MKYSENAVKKLLQAEELSLEDQIKVNILNFIRTIHLNRQDFIQSSYDSKFFGELPMTFQKKEGQVMGLITAKVNGEVRKFVFNDQGYDALEDILTLFDEI